MDVGEFRRVPRRGRAPAPRHRLCAQLPHGALRLYVMGERAARLEEATQEDAAAMRRLATEAMRAGAIGFSTSRTLNHRTATGDPTPSLRAGADELEAIALGVADAGHGVVELISDFWPDPDAEFALIRRLAERTGCPLSVSLAQSHQRPEAWRGLLAQIEQAAADGLPIRAQVARRDPSGSFWACSRRSIPSRVTPPSRSSPGSRSRRRSPPCATPPSGPASWRAGAPAAPCTGSSTTPGCTRWARCPTTSRRPRRACSDRPRPGGWTPPSSPLDLLAENDGRNFLFVPFSNFADGDLEACREMLVHPDTVFGLGDGGAHVGIIADASFPTYALSHWARDRATGACRSAGWWRS